MSKTSEQKIAIAKLYLELSNQHALDKIFDLFEQDATYESVNLNARFQGLDEIKAMMNKFFLETIPDVQWEVSHYEIASDFSSHLAGNRYNTGDAVVFNFVRISQQKPQFHNKQGREWVCINSRGKIYHIKVGAL